MELFFQIFFTACALYVFYRVGRLVILRVRAALAKKAQVRSGVDGSRYTPGTKLK